MSKCYGCGGELHPGESKFAGLCETCCDSGMPELYVLGKSRPDGQVALELARAIRFSARKVVEELRGLRADIREALDGTTDGLEALHEGLAAMTDEDPGCGEG